LLLADESLAAPKVLVGSDTGANLAAGLAEGADAAVLAGLVAAGSAHSGAAETALDVRSACPVHRRVVTEDASYDREALATHVPAALAASAVPSKPVLVLHGADDVVSDPATALASYLELPRARVRLVVGGRHDILNDVSHRSVAATIVLFLESLRLGSDLPAVVVSPATASGDVPATPLERSA
jgi:pimeloyl-ACP methyl ester carboxylesterase